MEELTEDHIRRLAWGVEFRMDVNEIPNGAYLQTPCTIYVWHSQRKQKSGKQLSETTEMQPRWVLSPYFTPCGDLLVAFYFPTVA